MSTLTWRKPALERHAHVGEELLILLGKVPKAASDLALYLFRHCIAGKFEEIDLYDLPLGEQRISEKRSGKRYSSTTLRGGLKILEREGLVVIRRRFSGGVFSLTVQHPGESRSFNHSQTNSFSLAQNKQTHTKTAQTQPPNDATALSITEEYRETTEQAEQVAIVEKVAKEAENEPVACRNDQLQKEIAAKSENLELGSNRKMESSENPEGTEICTEIRQVMPLSPQLKAEALKHTLRDVQAALTLFIGTRGSDCQPIFLG